MSLLSTHMILQERGLYKHKYPTPSVASLVKNPQGTAPDVSYSCLLLIQEFVDLLPFLHFGSEASGLPRRHTYRHIRLLLLSTSSRRTLNNHCTNLGCQMKPPKFPWTLPFSPNKELWATVFPVLLNLVRVNGRAVGSMNSEGSANTAETRRHSPISLISKVY